MKNLSLKALGASLLISGMTIVGLVAPASAAVVGATSTVTSFAESSTSPAFSVTTNSGLTTGGPFTEINIDVKKVGNTVPFTFWTLDSACPTTAGPLSGCKIASVSINGTPDTGATVKKMSMQPTSLTVLPSAPVASGSTVTVSFDAGAFTTGAAGSWEVRMITYRSGWASSDDSAAAAVTTSANGGGNGGGGSSATATITLGASTGQLVSGSTVAIVASGLQATAPYEVVVRSTPQTIGNGNAVSGAVNTSVTLPAGLEAGWHSLTFSSTASDGSTVTSVAYFKVSASGTLLATSSTIPAELANTGFDALPFLATGGMLALAGATIMLFARRRYSN